MSCAQLRIVDDDPSDRFRNYFASRKKQREQKICLQGVLFAKTEDRKRENPHARVSADDFGEFLALEQIAEKRKELEGICRL